MAQLSPADVTFVLLSFEGPDPYATAGGLGVRVTELSLALAEAGYPVHLLFLGDPAAPARETRLDGRLTLHRWGQWISQHHPAGVYQGEEGKLADFSASVPTFVVDDLVRPILAAGRLAVVMGEDSQTAEAMCAVSDGLWAAGLRQRAVLLWNANTTKGFERLNWGRLGFTTTLTTVSRYMGQLLREQGVDALVIPNGIPRRLLAPVEASAVALLRQSLGPRTILAKVARWDPDKRWLAAVELVAELRARARPAVLVARGGAEPHGSEVLAHAQTLGLMVKDVRPAEQTATAYAAAFAEAGDADVLNVTAAMPPAMLRLLYRAADAVLANSGSEPFGLVGLEAMAAGGVVFTGQTGEDYVRHLQNAIVLDTGDAAEAAWYVADLAERPEAREVLRREARETAGEFTWDRVLEELLGKIAFLASQQDTAPPAP